MWLTLWPALINHTHPQSSRYSSWGVVWLTHPGWPRKAQHSHQKSLSTVAYSYLSFSIAFSVQTVSTVLPKHRAVESGLNKSHPQCEHHCFFQLHSIKPLCLMKDLARTTRAALPGLVWRNHPQVSTCHWGEHCFCILALSLVTIIHSSFVCLTDCFETYFHLLTKVSPVFGALVTSWFSSRHSSLNLNH